MRKVGIRSVFAIALLLIVCTACMRNQPTDSDIPRYSNVEDIVNPPDEFQLVYILNTYNNYLALLEFETDAVWKIERLTTPGFIRVWGEREDGSTEFPQTIIDAQNDIYYVGLAGGILYNFWASRSASISEKETLLLHFTKQNIDYENFTPKI